jgi:hypothetical protein
MQLETIEFLQESQERHRLELGDNSQNPSFQLLDPDAQRALVGLGESMVRDGTVPDIDRQGRSSSSYNSCSFLRMPDDFPRRVDPPEPVEPPKIVNPALKDARIIHWNSIRTRGSNPGLIHGLNGRKIPQTPSYDRSLPEDIISETLAISLGAKIDQSQIPKVWIDLGGGQMEQCIGVVEVRWERENQQSFSILGIKGNLPFTTTFVLRCFVFRNVVPAFTLARDY